MTQDELSGAFHELLDEVAAIEKKILAADPPLDEPDVLDGYRLTFSLLRAECEKSSDPCQVLQLVNRYLLKMNAMNMFVTLIYCLLDYNTGVLTYARAGHVLPIVLDGKGRKVTIPMDVGQPLGLFEDVRFDRQQVQIPPGGLALFYTDGLSEAGDESGREFGSMRILKVLQEQRNETGKLICKHLWDAVQEYCGGSVHKDDFATLVIKRL